jgi:hypothetical protein
VRWLRTGLTVGLCASSLSCGARDPEVVASPLAPPVVLVPPPAPQPGCPAGTFVEQGRCVRIVASEEIPTWAPPSGHLDPCATLTSDNAVYDCDPRREYAADGGARPTTMSP